ncbi:DNA polymerase epsilon catalytic subunit [Saccharomycopsis crataegensis]|uniref:DNA polymerase epsilon catalytic subunit n=1 Tax=Saccharomycopsis crataegensis TaxID=43959 RepID=A0AAV5QM88_9ASCO|nr:DNA polymerase epsilon catalytic subunit [Saccharomycopsis crataegensis]
MSGKFKGSTTARFVKNNRNNNGNSKTPNYNKFGNNQSRSSYNGKSQNRNKDIERMSKLEAARKLDQIDSMMGFDRYEAGPKRTGWLINFHPTLLPSSQVLDGVAACDFYFLDEEGGSFKTSVQYDPYFFLICRNNTEIEVEEALKKNLEGTVKKYSRVQKEDLVLPNHLIGLKRQLLKLTFHNLTDMLDARRFLNPIIQENKKKKDARDVYSAVNINYMEEDYENSSHARTVDALEYIDDIKEYDVPFHVRVAIDKNLRVGKWYSVQAESEEIHFEELDVVVPPDPVVLAFDIETSKAPLKFPDSAVDQIMMISYMIDGDGYLITNREIISKDIEDFEYTPKPEYPGNFEIFNAENEEALIKRFFEHIREVRPTVISTFNGDFFDWPFVDNRANFHGISMFDEIGFKKDSEDEYKSTYCCHMDCYRWVKRDSYLPQGSQGLKAVTTVKLGYNPIELDPELMTPYAIEKPQVLSEYSVSDAVATYYLYYNYVHPFIFSLATIIPLNADEVLRKGTGTLCEMLLMVQAYENNILLPNKHTDPLERFYDGHLLESETYVGGHVESLEAGVFRSDLETSFKIDPTVIDELLQNVEDVVKFFVTVECNKKIEDVTNFEEVAEKIKEELIELKNKPKRTELPLIYHVDVASMYPNIMISNRLQPDSMKTEEDCAACDFNRPGKVCDRSLTWAWRGEYYPAKMDEYAMIKRAMQNETFPPTRSGGEKRYFDELSYTDQVTNLKKRISDYSRKVYHRIKVSETINKDAIVCQRENPFYIDTVRNFRDRRYTYKGLAKKWKKKSSTIDKSDHHAIDEAKKMVITYDSLQLAHKVILNSFYGYVMRKGSRWYSMEMAGITCLTGATIIQMARALIERFGRPLELDTDGIWCIIPKSFPDEFDITLKDGSKLGLPYLCSMLNHLVHLQFTNHQYQELIPNSNYQYEVKSENSIFFELDGPYKAMILPTSKEEGKGIKKRYAVFNYDGSLAELKGFELKRRGELEIVKNMQGDLFPAFLEGDSLENCYKEVASIANKWLGILLTKGKNIEDEDLINLIGERKSMSKSIEEYNGMKSTSITTVKRLVEFLGIDVKGDSGITARFIISNKPKGAPIAERAVPIAIFSADITQKRHFLRKWLGDNVLEDFDPRTILDWDYYFERLASVVLKIISIPAYLQIKKNPCETVQLPAWISKRIQEDQIKQTKLTSFFSKSDKPAKITEKDIEDLMNDKKAAFANNSKFGTVHSRKRKLKNKKNQSGDEDVDTEAIEKDILDAGCPDATVDYVGWLTYNKVIWKQNDKKREANKKIFGEYSSGTANHNSSISNMVREKAKTYATNASWQVLDYKLDNVLGQIRAKVLIDGKIRVIKIKVPKEVYLTFNNSTNNLSEEQVEEMREKKISIEPSKATIIKNSKPVYKAIMDELVFNENIHKPGSILQKSNIYESQVTAKDRAIMNLGSTISFESDELGGLYKGLQFGFNSSKFQPVDHSTYLKKFDVDLVYLSHVTSNKYEVYFVFNSWEPIVSVFILKPSEKAQDFPENKKLEAVYSDIYKSNEDDLAKFSKYLNYASEVDLDLQYFTNLQSLNKKLNAKIASLYEERSSSAILALQTPFIDRIYKTIKSVHDFPIIKLSYNEIVLPALRWQEELMKKVFVFFFSLGSWVRDLLELSRYSNIPICNLELNNIGYLIDIQYSRRLKANNVVLWWSSNTNSDLGGAENKKLVPITESLVFPNINNPDSYESVALEISIQNLTINTVLTSALINQAEGSDLADQNDVFMGGSDDRNSGAPSTEFSIDSFNTNALSVLRGMVKDWWDDAVGSSEYADLMINNFVKWIQKKGSFLYDPSLEYHVHNLTKKTLLQMIQEFKKMGSTVIFTNRSKIFLKTSKTSIENSYAYSQYILKAVRTKPLFNYLDMKILKYWDILVWMDDYNYAGRACETISETGSQDLKLYSHWQIAKFLPPIYQTEFTDWISIFLDALVKEKENNINANTARLTQINPPANPTDLDNEGLDDMDGEKVVISDAFASVWNPLKKRVKKLYGKQNSVILSEAFREEYRFPVLPGSHLKFGNPTLELVKHLCAVFALSKKRNLESRSLRKELLNYLDVREFSDESSFKNPSVSLKISEVLCNNCGLIRDVDFCRDEEEDIWSCVQCRQPLNKVSLEESLIADFKRNLALFYTQDLKCERCGKIRDDELSPFCKCSGNWVGVINKNALLRRVQIFSNVADFFDLRFLKNTLQGI